MINCHRTVDGSGLCVGEMCFVYQSSFSMNELPFG